MSRSGDVDDIVKSFVDSDLASLDKIGQDHNAVTLESTKYIVPPSPGHSDSARSRPGSLNSQSTSNKRGSYSGAFASKDGATVSRSRSGSYSASPPVAPTSAGSVPAPSSSLLNNKRVSSHTSSNSISSIPGEKRSTLGDKFKHLGRRIASSSKKD